MALMPPKPVPSLELQTLDGPVFKLSKEQPETFVMIVFYRGLHCPVCRRYLTELDGMMDEFVKRGLIVCVASSDSRERAERTRSDWSLRNINLAYGLPLEEARQWCLYISASRGKTSIGVEEPAQFSEPCLFSRETRRHVVLVERLNYAFRSTAFW